MEIPLTLRGSSGPLAPSKASNRRGWPAPWGSCGVERKPARSSGLKMLERRAKTSLEGYSPPRLGTSRSHSWRRLYTRSECGGEWGGEES